MQSSTAAHSRQSRADDRSASNAPDRGPITRLLISWLGIAAAVAATTAVVPGVTVDGGAVTYLWIAAVLAAVNVVVGGILRLIGRPLIWLTLGLFGLVIDACVLVVVDGLMDALEIDGLGAALVAALVMSLLTVLVWVVVFASELRARATAPRMA